MSYEERTSKASPKISIKSALYLTPFQKRKTGNDAASFKPGIVNSPNPDGRPWTISVAVPSSILAKFVKP